MIKRFIAAALLLCITFSGTNTVPFSVAGAESEIVPQNNEQELPDGDVNDDCIFGISDVVIVQKWLLKKSATDIQKWKAADFCSDGKLDVYDLCLMRKALAENCTGQGILSVEGYMITSGYSGWGRKNYNKSITKNDIAGIDDIAELYDKVYAKAEKLQDTPMISWELNICDYGIDDLYLPYVEENGAASAILLCSMGGECSWLDDADVQKLAELLAENGLYSDYSIIQFYLTNN